jgi:hypothetical protein
MKRGIMLLGHIRVKDFLNKTNGKVRGSLLTDAKIRTYYADYIWEEDENDPEYIWVSREGNTGDKVKIKAVIDLNESLVAFFGLYSGDGAKGSEDPKRLGRVKATISFCQKEPNLIRFATEQFRYLFPGAIRFTFSLGEDSAYFMGALGLELLQKSYGGNLPPTPSLEEVHPILNDADKRYLTERRSVLGTNEEHLAFYYFHKAKMEAILRETKREQIEKAGIDLEPLDNVTASMRRPFKKGAREPGGTSRADETFVGGVNGMGELFLKMLHEVEGSIESDIQVSLQGLIHWIDLPSKVGEVIDIAAFFSHHNFGKLAGQRPNFEMNSLSLFEQQNHFLKGLWPRSKLTLLYPTLRIDPLWCYTSGLYLAEGTTDKAIIFSMFCQSLGNSGNGSKIGLSFTSSENTSLELLLRALRKLFPLDQCLDAWKIKVGSQYFPELVVSGLKNGVPMLRGGQSGDGKMRTMEISLAIKNWALTVAPAMMPFAERYSHVEPTGAGVPRIDFWASSALCRWYFPLIIYAAFGRSVKHPDMEFC